GAGRSLAVPLSVLPKCHLPGRPTLHEHTRGPARSESRFGTRRHTTSKSSCTSLHPSRADHRLSETEGTTVPGVGDRQRRYSAPHWEACEHQRPVRILSNM